MMSTFPLKTGPETPIHEGPAALARLGELGINPEWLIDAVFAAAMARNGTTKLDPPGADGMNAYFAAVRVLSERVLGEAGDEWQRIEPHNIPRVVNKQTGIAIAVSGADAYAGLRGRGPKSRNDKGLRFQELVEDNNRQLALFQDSRFRPVPPLEQQVTYVLLYYSDELGTVRAELSLPTGLDDEARLAAWQERIILDIPAFDGGLRDRRDDEDEEELQVTVTSRG